MVLPAIILTIVVLLLARDCRSGSPTAISDAPGEWKIEWPVDRCQGGAGSWGFSGTLTNLSAEAHTYEVEVRFLREDDRTQGDRGVVRVKSVPPGESVAVRAVGVASLPAADVFCQVEAVVDPS